MYVIILTKKEKGVRTMAVPIRKQETNNIIELSLINGKLGVKPKVRYNKDGSIDKRHPNKGSLSVHK